LRAIHTSCEDIGAEAPKIGFTFLGYRGRDWDPAEVVEHARLAISFAKKYPQKKFGFDIAGPEDTGYGAKEFQEAFDLIKDHNSKTWTGEIEAEQIGLTIHAGETPTYDDGNKGSQAVADAISLGVNRIGHAVQAISDPAVLELLQKNKITVEICGVCNISSIPLNADGLAVHPVQEFIYRNIPVTICTDNDALCRTSITKEYAQFLLTGHRELMNWNNVKRVAKNGILSGFISDSEKADALKIFGERIRVIEKLGQQKH
jgi:adenosine deaminase